MTTTPSLQSTFRSFVFADARGPRPRHAPNAGPAPGPEAPPPLETGDKTERRAGRQSTAAERNGAAPEPLPPWHEVAAAWRRVRACYDGLFSSDEEEEQARVAFHQSGAHWRVYLTAINERKRDYASLAGRRP